MSLTNDVEKVRIEIGDTESGLYILTDAVISYFLDKHSNNIRRASLDCARAILFRLSLDSSESSVDILTLKGDKASTAYKEALLLYMKSPELNPVLSSAGIYAGGVSKSDMVNNLSLDNNFVGGDGNSFSVPSNLNCL